MLFRLHDCSKSQAATATIMVKSNALRNRAILQETPRRVTATKTERRIHSHSRQHVAKGSSPMVMYIAIALLLIVIAACLMMYIHLIGIYYSHSPRTSLSLPTQPSDESHFERKKTLYPPPFPEITRTPIHLSPEALEMCTRTLWHTVETTTIVLPNEETFIHTGDIDDLWLRVRLPFFYCLFSSFRCYPSQVFVWLLFFRLLSIG